MRKRTVTRVSLVVGALVASAAFAGGVAVAGPSAQGAAKARCEVVANKGYNASVLDKSGRKVDEIPRGKSRASACGTTTHPIGSVLECGGATRTVVRLAGTKDVYVPITCVTHRH
ncbi:hypothetical protein [Allokutzneria oryzae]|uniref:Secreted protein n=1 Tax=Allokutzneria oryzae TaxID=1378989 RepID=A0ABV6A158_9PSEU